jgi:hypothetical protein
MRSDPTRAESSPPLIASTSLRHLSPISNLSPLALPDHLSRLAVAFQKGKKSVGHDCFPNPLGMRSRRNDRVFPLDAITMYPTKRVFITNLNHSGA